MVSCVCVCACVCVCGCVCGCGGVGVCVGVCVGVVGVCTCILCVGYPNEEAAHVALATTREWLVHNADKVRALLTIHSWLLW